MQIYTPTSALLGALLFSIIAPSAYARSLDETLRAHNLTLVADFFKTHPPDSLLFNRPDLIVYAPTDNAMQEYFDANGIAVANTGRPRYLLGRDMSTEIANANILLSQGDPDFFAGGQAVFNSGGNGTEHNKVVEGNPSLTMTSSMSQDTTTTQSGPRTSPTETLTLLTTTDTTVTPTDTTSTTTTLAPSGSTPVVKVITLTTTLAPEASGISKRALEEGPAPVSWFAKIYSGNGHLSYVLENKIPFDGGVFYTMDRCVLSSVQCIPEMTVSNQ